MNSRHKIDSLLHSHDLPLTFRLKMLVFQKQATIYYYYCWLCLLLIELTDGLQVYWNVPFTSITIIKFVYL